MGVGNFNLKLPDSAYDHRQDQIVLRFPCSDTASGCKGLKAGGKQVSQFLFGGGIAANDPANQVS
jgi:hypothetical protein